MRVRTLALWAGLGVLSTSAAALAIPVPSAATHGSGSIRLDAPSEPGGPAQVQSDPSHFVAGQTLSVDARLGHASVRRGPDARTFLFASVTGADQAMATPPLNLAIVIDRSGSMAGKKLANAIAAAVGAVERMRDGDSVTVISFDTAASVVVPPTRTTASTRASIEAAIRGVRLGGDTCISCGLELAMKQLDATTLGRDQVNRMILLSDGEATHGVKDVPGARAMAAQMRDRGFSITTIGVDVTFDEKYMAAVAVESNGRHYFVAEPSALASIFDEEFKSLEASLARDAELTVELAPGVEVDEVFDRTFRREGSRVIVPFGTFSAREEKTVLMRVRVPADREGDENVARLRLSYRDLVARSDGTCAGALGLAVRSDGTEQRDLDPFVAARVARSRTAQTLTQANKLFEQGKVDEARAALARGQAELKKDESQALAHATAAPAKAKGRNLNDDFADQERAIATAEANFAPPPVAAGAAPAPPPAPQSTAGRGAVRLNQSKATDFGF